MLYNRCCFSHSLKNNKSESFILYGRSKDSLNRVFIFWHWPDYSQRGVATRTKRKGNPISFPRLNVSVDVRFIGLWYRVAGSKRRACQNSIGQEHVRLELRCLLRAGPRYTQGEKEKRVRAKERERKSERERREYTGRDYERVHGPRRSQG